MYCSTCKADSNSNFCTLCGKKAYSSKEQHDIWMKRYGDYSVERLADILNNASEYQKDALIAAEELIREKGAHSTGEIGNVTEHIQSQIWYYAYNGQQIGPVSEWDLVRLYKNEVIDERTLVWRKGYDDWKKLSSSEIILPIQEAKMPPPLDAKNIKNTGIWILLVMPIISSFITILISGIFNINPVNIWWLTWVLNALFCEIDCYHLRKAGYPTDKIIRMAVFLVPVYIYRRMKLVNGKRWIFTFLWIIVFIADILIPDLFWVKSIGISNPGVIDSVRYGTFSFCPDDKIDDIFNATIKDCNWDTYLDADRDVYVTLKGTYCEEDIKFVFRFINNTQFKISSIYVEGEKCSNSKEEMILGWIWEEYKDTN